VYAAATRIDFKVLIYRELDCDGDFVYVAQCLNYDLVTQGESILAVLNSLECIIKTQIKLSLEDGIEPFSDFEPAPRELWKKYEANASREKNAFSFSCDPAEKPLNAVAMMKLAA